MTRAWVVLRPMDVVEFRDGRPFTARLTSSARTTMPRPTSTAGAIGAAFGREPATIEGPVLVRSVGGTSTLLLTCPGDVVFDHEQPLLLARPQTAGPAPSGGTVTTDLGSRDDLPHDWRLPSGEKGEAKPVLLDADQMGLYLSADPSLLDHAESSHRLTEVLRTERRVGLARAGRAARVGFLYAAEFLRFDDNDARYGFACRVTFTDEQDSPAAARVVRLGGEARQAEVSVLAADDRAAPALPPAPDAFPGGRLLLYLATPAIFANGWLPDDLGGGRVVSAVVGRPEVAASWLRGERSAEPVRWAAPAGSVYFLQFGTDLDAEGFAKHHGTCLRQSDDRLRTAGFGMCLIGRW